MKYDAHHGQPESEASPYPQHFILAFLHGDWSRSLLYGLNHGVGIMAGYLDEDTNEDDKGEVTYLHTGRDST